MAQRSSLVLAAVATGNSQQMHAHTSTPTLGPATSLPSNAASQAAPQVCVLGMLHAFLSPC